MKIRLRSLFQESSQVFLHCNQDLTVVHLFGSTSQFWKHRGNHCSSVTTQYLSQYCWGPKCWVAYCQKLLGSIQVANCKWFGVHQSVSSKCIHSVWRKKKKKTNHNKTFTFLKGVPDKNLMKLPSVRLTYTRNGSRNYHKWESE